MVEAPAPYDAQIKELRRQVGAVFIRQSMKDASGATVMDPATQVTSLHGVSMLDAAREPFESNLCLAVLRERNGPNDNALANIAIAAHVNLHGDPILAAAEAARAAGNAPNAVLAAAACILGPGRVEGARRATETLLELFLGRDPATRSTRRSTSADIAADAVAARRRRRTAGPRPCWRRSRRARARSVFVRYLRGLGDHVTADAVLAAMALTLAWGPLQRKRISRRTALNLPWYLALYGTLIGASVPAERHTAAALLRRPQRRDAARLDRDRARRPGAAPAGGPARTSCSPTRCCSACCSPTGPGTISAQGAKGAVSADGPESPERVQLNKAMVGFLTHTGFSHGGNGFEGIQFLLEQFEGRAWKTRRGAGHGVDLAAMATRFAQAYKQEKTQRRELAADGAGPSPASTTRCSAASRSTPTRARPSSPS